MARTILNGGTCSPLYGNVTLTTGSAHGYSTTSATTINLTGGGTGGASGASGSLYTMSTNGASWINSNPYVISGTSASPSLQVTGDADIKGDLKVGGISINETLAKINERLAILVPDPKRLEKYEALKQAYEHYKLLEALCVDETNTGEKK